MNITIDQLLAFLRTARGHNLNLSQLVAMLALRADGPMNLTSVAAATRISSTGITMVADSLEASGYVTRVRTADRRIINLALTEAGLDAIALILDALDTPASIAKAAIPA